MSQIDPMTAAYNRQISEASAADRQARELTRDDLKHIRRLVADQVALSTTSAQRVEAVWHMVRDLVSAALTPDVREIVTQLHQIRGHAQEADIMNASYRAELQRYIDKYGVLEVDDGSEGQE